MSICNSSFYLHQFYHKYFVWFQLNIRIDIHLKFGIWNYNHHHYQHYHHHIHQHINNHHHISQCTVTIQHPISMHMYLTKHLNLYKDHIAYYYQNDKNLLHILNNTIIQHINDNQLGMIMVQVVIFIYIY